MNGGKGKEYGKVLDLGTLDADWVFLSGEYICLWCTMVLARSLVFVVTRFSGNCRQPHAVSVRIVFSFPDTSSDLWDHRKTIVERFSVQ